MKSANVSWPLYIRNGFGRRLAQFGELVGSQRLIYNPMVMRQFHDEAVANASRVIPPVLGAFPNACRFLDVGSGSGAFSAELLREAKLVVALERSPHGRALADKQGVDCRPFDLMIQPPARLDGAFDLVFCFEVAEHMPPFLGDKLIHFIASLKTPVLFSAAHVGQGGTGHVNEQPDTYWIERFVKLGFRFDPELTRRLRQEFSGRGAASWFRTNPFVCFPT